MGGKTKLLDLEQLEKLYAESRGYEQRVNTGLQVIQKELNKLNELSIRNAVARERGREWKKAVSLADNAIAALKENFEQTKRFIEVKLAGAVNLSPVRAHSSSPAGQPRLAAAFPIDGKLKK
jgi:hypothetical protein